MILFVSMDTENNLSPEQKKIRDLLEEAAKRHREIEQKIHPEKYDVNISVEKILDKPEQEKKIVHEDTPLKQMPPVIESSDTFKSDYVKEKTRINKSDKIDETLEPIESETDVKASKIIEDPESQKSKRNISSLHTLAHNYSINPEIKTSFDVTEDEPEIIEQITFTGEGEIHVEKKIIKDISEIKDVTRIEEKPEVKELFLEEPEVSEETKEEEFIALTKEPEEKEILEPEKTEHVISTIQTDEPLPQEILGTTDLPFLVNEKKDITSKDSETYDIIGTSDIPFSADEKNNITSEELIKSAASVNLETDTKAIEQIDLEQETESEEFLKAIDTTNSTVYEKPFITDFDLHLFSQGTFYKVYEKFGAHIVNKNNVNGVQFTTWAPNAEAIYVIGEFNGWNEEDNYKLQRLNDNGIWTGFIAGLKKGDTYKYSIKSNVHGEIKRKADPYAFRSEVRPKNASIIEDIDNYKWNDNEWMSSRRVDSYKEEPMNIYEVHLGSWRRDWNNKEHPNEWGYLSYGTLAKEIVAYVKKMGYTHIELMPIMEHPLDISWGYQVTHYYAPTSRFGSPEDFMYFVDYCHQNGIGVILDWVPAHFPYDEHALAYFDGKQIYAYENEKRGIHKDWGTFIFDYGKPEVQNFLIGSALFWLEKYHADGLRVDAVASMLYLDYSRNQGEWEPNIHGGREHLEAIGFLKHLNEKVHEYHPGTVMIAEESTSWPGVSHKISDGGLGFDMKWNMGWMNDILLYFSKDPVHRKFHQGKLTFSLWYAFSENFVLPVSHDEVVHGKKSLLEKMPGDNWQKFANLRLFLGFMMGHPGKKLNFMTTDIGQYREWNCEDSMEWNLLDLDLNKKLNLYAADINKLYKDYPSLFQVDFNSSGFQWIDFSDSLHSVFSFIRTSKDKTETLFFTFNMTPTIRTDYHVGVPEAGYWKEILNSDSGMYGGSDIGNMGGKDSENIPYKDWKQSIRVTLPPLAVNVFKLERRE